MYNYRKEIEKDIRDVLDDYIPYYDTTDPEEIKEKLKDDLWIDDSVTGNGSGIYTNKDTKPWVMDNMDLCIDALKEFDVSGETIAEHFLTNDWDYFDITIRCYLLSECIDEVMEVQENV